MFCLIYICNTLDVICLLQTPHPAPQKRNGYERNKALNLNISELDESQVQIIEGSSLSNSFSTVNQGVLAKQCASWDHEVNVKQDPSSCSETYWLPNA